jgi:hypothetical protein
MGKQTIWYVPCSAQNGTAETKFFNSRDSYEHYAENNRNNLIGEVSSFTVDGNIEGLNLTNDTNMGQSSSQTRETKQPA